ncbi:RimJ/RimL family protein N-acetyltransferase [Paenibacillus phyllosphaerae]|uniref:RimJ/RimL family protein N-acetyltransferase n=1 Tax=Paenibacillus phyllosphaerae TaxID=274593 RepID=A0A7W5FQC4_9BACL|nr:GNAT family protein [Paenibacillus phyllosphaerae]MBB3113143.1 RimJ/RimL family protein N-acetyltransferase [Paenibacillus phyllosphaerae]
MSLHLREFCPVTETEDLIAFLTGESWPFHGVAKLTEETVREQIANGRYHSDEGKKTFWAVDEGEQRVGLVRVFELGDPTPMFDLRIAERYRGRGYGLAALRLLVEYVFTTYEDKPRLEGHTRFDNHAMRKVLHHAGFVKEAVHRQAWPSADGQLHDSIGYAILREDWLHNTVTPIQWDDFPY